MLNRRAISRITNYDVFTRKGPIIFKVYKEDGTSEIILNFKASYLHLGEWREVMKACLNRTRKGWEIIYKHIGTRMDYIYTTESELDPVIVVDDSDEDEDDEVHSTENVETEDTSVSKSSSPRSSQLKELLVKSLKIEFSNILSAHDFSSSLPTKMKDLPSKFDELTEEVKGLKKQVHELEIELPGDLKEISTKLEDFIKTVTSLTSQVTELKTLQWELPVEFLLLPIHVESVQAKLKTLDTLLSLLLNVIKSLNKFA
ncbi:hypothetical protein Tco_1297456 [Tanacetum coccineum]